MKSIFIFVCSLVFIEAKLPLALHQLIEVETGGEVVLKLNGFDLDGDKVGIT